MSRLNIIFLLIIGLSLLSLSCGGRSLSVVNGYHLETGDDLNSFFIKDAKFDKVLNIPLSDFSFDSGFLYGLTASGNDSFYIFDTTSGESILFENWEELNAHTKKLGLQNYSMKNSFTFLDLSTGHKKSPW